MLPLLRRPASTAWPIAVRFFSASTTSAASRATSTALRGQMPTSAACRAARSLTPSPRKPVVWPPARSAATIRALCSGVQRAKTVARSATETSSASERPSSESAVTTSSAPTGPPGCRPRSEQIRAAVPGWSPVSTLTATPRRASTPSAAAALGSGTSRSATRPRKVSPRSSAGVYAPARAARSARATASRRSPLAAFRSARARSRSRSSRSRAQRSSTASTAPLVTSVWTPIRPGFVTTAVATRRTGSKGSTATPSYASGSTSPGSGGPYSSTASSTASSSASAVGSSARWSVQKAPTAAHRSTSGAGRSPESVAPATTGRSSVSVPVLSRHSTSTAPRSCRAGSRLTITPPVRASRAAPRARAVVTMTGSISGVSPTATATANGSVSRPRPRSAALAISTRGGVSSMKRMSVQEIPWTDRSKALAPRGPARPSCVAAKRVSPPVATITAVPLPDVTLLPWKHHWGCAKGPAPDSAGSGTSRARLTTGADSPVSADWCTVRPSVRSSCTSAGTRSPARSRITSPGTRSATGASRSTGEASSDARRTTVAVVATSSRRLAVERSARCSSAERSTQLTATRARMTQAVPQAETTAETSPRQSSTEVNGSRRLRRKRRGQGTGRRAGSTFSPVRARRTSASASTSPRGPLPRARSVCRGVGPCTAGAARPAGSPPGSPATRGPVPGNGVTEPGTPAVGRP